MALREVKIIIKFNFMGLSSMSLILSTNNRISEFQDIPSNYQQRDSKVSKAYHMLNDNMHKQINGFLTIEFNNDIFKLNIVLILSLFLICSFLSLLTVYSSLAYPIN